MSDEPAEAPPRDSDTEPPDPPWLAAFEQRMADMLVDREEKFTKWVNKRVDEVATEIDLMRRSLHERLDRIEMNVDILVQDLRTKSKELGALNDRLELIRASASDKPSNGGLGDA